jgi:hypothetical protein
MRSEPPFGVAPVIVSNSARAYSSVFRLSTNMKVFLGAGQPGGAHQGGCHQYRFTYFIAVSLYLFKNINIYQVPLFTVHRAQ